MEMKFHGLHPVVTETYSKSLENIQDSKGHVFYRLLSPGFFFGHHVDFKQQTERFRRPKSLRQLPGQRPLGQLREIEEQHEEKHIEEAPLFWTRNSPGNFWMTFNLL